jgi:membrane fusion protein, multidrug efflux system
MRKTVWWVGAVTVVACVGAAAWVIGRAPGTAAQASVPQAGKPEVALEFTAREVVRPERRAMPVQLEFSGPLVAPSTAVVRAKASGTLVSLAVAEGSRVRAGQTLGQMDLAEITSRVQERQAGVASARAQLAQAQKVHESNQRLADQQFISPNALDTSKAALTAAQAAYDASLAQLASSQVGLRQAALVAPMGGLVSKRHALAGEKLAPEQPVVTIVDLSTLELAGSVATHEVSRLEPGMPVELRIEGQDQPTRGNLARIAPAAEAGTRAIGVTVTLANPKEQLRAGQYALARVVVDDPVPRLTVPSHALGNAAGQDHVWVIDQGALARRSVTLGRRDEVAGRVEVLTGLSVESTVLAARFEGLREGRKAVLAASSAGTDVAPAASRPSTPSTNPAPR